MRLDHFALRVEDRDATADFYVKCFGYKVAQEFPINFDDGSKASCLALSPPEKPYFSIPLSYPEKLCGEQLDFVSVNYHLAPDIFISSGSPNSIVGRWVATRRSGDSLIHHLAYQVDSVLDVMEKWLTNKWAEFTTKEPISCPGLKQIFTQPNKYTGLVYEFIQRDGELNFCKDNVKQLMVSSDHK